MNTPSVAVVGATGAVGEELLRVFEERDFGIRELRLLASARSAGKVVSFRGESHTVEETQPERLTDVDLVFLSAGATVSRELRPHLEGTAAHVYDNTSAFRMDPEVPLIVPEVNGHTLGDEQWVAVPNCTAALLVLALSPLQRAFGLQRVVMSSYQAVSGAGRRALERMQRECRAFLAGEPVPDEPEPLGFNVLPWIDTEEVKLAQETRRMLEAPDLPLVVTCVRVPVVRAHSESVLVELGGSPSLAEVQQAFEEAPAVTLGPYGEGGCFPTPARATGTDGILLGRLRPADRPGSFAFFISGDQLRKGAALNAVQIAELQRSRLA